MSKVIFDISMSLDGFITAANRRPEEPMGDGGERLHVWAFEGAERDREVLEAGVASSGAVITGRRTYDDSVPWWGSDGPTGPARLPVFVLSHQIPEVVPDDGVYTFIDTGIEDALNHAQAASGDKIVCIMGGAKVGQAYLAAGLVDELSIHLVPVLFGSGTRLFDDVGALTKLENLSVIQTPWATHLRYRIPKSSQTARSAGG
jgi:dihydrofolate reductase